MKIKEFTQNYSRGKRIKFHSVLREVQELLEEIIKLNRAGMKEEWQDSWLFFQIWLYWRFGINGELWSFTKDSVNKFMARKAVWQQIYESVGLPRDISNYVGNYNRVEKVIKQLGDFGVDENQARKAWEKIVVPNLKNIKRRDVSILIPYKIKDNQVLVYLERRSKTAERLPDFYGFWGGGIEIGETPEQALIREVKEEMSIDLKGYKFFREFKFTISISYLYYLLVDDNFETTIKLTEAQYGKFFTEEGIVAEEKLIENDKIRLSEFFKFIKTHKSDIIKTDK